jgi:hypothetical protein
MLVASLTGCGTMIMETVWNWEEDAGYMLLDGTKDPALQNLTRATTNNDGIADLMRNPNVMTMERVVKTSAPPEDLDTPAKRRTNATNNGTDAFVWFTPAQTGTGMNVVGSQYYYFNYRLRIDDATDGKVLYNKIVAVKVKNTREFRKNPSLPPDADGHIAKLFLDDILYGK